jgi:hypothetical protein
MSMFEPLLPKSDDHDSAPAAAEPGPGAPGVPDAEEPDVLPENTEDTEHVEDSENAHDDAPGPGGAHGDSPFRTPRPGESLSVDELDDRN